MVICSVCLFREIWTNNCFPSIVIETILPKTVLFIYCYDLKLVFFCSSGHSEIVKFLLSRGADIDALSFSGTPLSLAALRGHASTVKILLQHNADVIFKIFIDLLAFYSNSFSCWLFVTFSNSSNMYLVRLLVGDLPCKCDLVTRLVCNRTSGKIPFLLLGRHTSLIFYH